MHMRAKLNLQQTHEAQHGAAKCSQVQASPAEAKKHGAECEGQIESVADTRNTAWCSQEQPGAAKHSSSRKATVQAQSAAKKPNRASAAIDKHDDDTLVH